MNKISLSIVSVALLTSSAFAMENYSSYADKASEAQSLAGEAAPSKSAFKGFYAGAVGAYGFAKIPTQKKNFLANGLSGGILLGYGTVVGGKDKGLYLGVDSSFMLGSQDGKASLTEDLGAVQGNKVTNLSYKHKNSFKIAAQIGYALQKFLPYIEVGLESASVSGRIDSVTTPPAGAAETSSFRFSKRQTNFLLGTGLKFSITPHVVTSLGYSLSFHKKIGGSSTDFNFKDRKDNKVFLAVAYKF